MVKRSEQIKSYRLKKSWKNTFYIFGVLLFILGISIAIGFFSGLTHLEDVINQDFNNIVYAYDDKIDYLFTQIDYSNDNVFEWRSDINVKVDAISLVVTTELTQNEILQMINNLEYDIHNLENLEQVDIDSLNMYNTRVTEGVIKYNQDVLIYNNAIDSNYGKWFKQFNPDMEKALSLVLQVTDI